VKFSRTILPFCAALVLTTGLVACSSDEVVKTESTPSASESSPEPTETTEAASGDFVSPAWATPVTNPGDLLTTIEGTNFTVDIYQVGTDIATKSGQFADPETNEPILAVGDEIVYVNYVVTNTSDTDIPLSYNLVDVTARYADWPYLQGMDSVVDRDLDAKMEINTSAIAPNTGEAPFILAAGESFSFGENFKYQAGSPITFAATLTESDEAGDLDHDTRQEVEVESTIE